MCHDHCFMLYLVVRVPRSDIPVRDIKNHRCHTRPLQMPSFLVGIAAAKVAAEFPQFGFWHVHPPRCTEDRRNTRRGSIRFSCFAFFPPLPVLPWETTRSIPSLSGLLLWVLLLGKCLGKKCCFTDVDAVMWPELWGRAVLNMMELAPLFVAPVISSLCSL